MNPKRKGRLIVIEGVDGSGKSTQFARLCQRVQERGLSFLRLVFPQYQEESSALIRMYLRGEFGGTPDQVNPYAASAFYAVDRYASWKKVWEETYGAGGLILADRYTTSNAVHQACKLEGEARREYLRWLSEFEYEKMALPRPDLVIYLDLPTEKALELMKRRQAETQTQGDIHELDADYLMRSRHAALEAIDLYGWVKIDCLDAKGNLRSIEDISQEIWRFALEALE